ncbi:hypothetical protein RF11_11756 [Thelohanellus kitauei]|uniref:Uncharacterized protein n=1 Tax=Thelohanellus kitauei TaxID=669202 RepID=A0A0C2JPF6_THEKT|nr:hypothetical protein RF11_11756 [Thelohanellus kitauei]
MSNPGDLIVRDYHSDFNTDIIEKVLEVSYGKSSIKIVTNVFLTSCKTALQPLIEKSKTQLTPEYQKSYKTLLNTDCREISNTLKDCIRTKFRDDTRNFFRHRYHT